MIRNIYKLSLFKRCVVLRHLSSNPINIEQLEQESALQPDVIDEESKLREAEIDSKRNKSKLTDAHRNMLHGVKPYNEPMHWSHGTLKYNRRLYGVYGEASGVNPAICFPTKKELSQTLEFEKVAYPYTISQVMETSKRMSAEKAERIQKRQRDIAEKMLKLDKWCLDLKAKVAKKEADAKAAKDRKDKLIEDVRRHFGYTVDPKDDKFKEMLAMKEKEQKKVMKEARRKAKEDKLITKLLNKDEVDVEKESEAK